MKMIVLASALSMMAIAPAAAQAPMVQPGAMSCVSGGQFVPCPPGTQMPNPGMGMGGQQAAAQQPGMQQGAMAAAEKPKGGKKAKKRRAG